MEVEERPLEMPPVGEGLEAMTFDVAQGEEGALDAAAAFSRYGMCIMKNLLPADLAQGKRHAFKSLG